MRNKFPLLFLLIPLLLLAFPNIVLAYTQVLGVKDARGQVKKQEVDVTVGTVDRVLPNKIGILTREGKKVEVNTNNQTKFLEKPSGKKLGPELLKKDDKVATFATGSAQATVFAKLVLVKPATDSAVLKKRRAVYGLVRSINGNRLVVSHPIRDDPRYTIEVVDATFIKVKGIEGATIEAIRVGDRIAAVGIWQDEILVVKRVHVIPGKAIGLLERIGTRSATPSATDSATP